MDVGSGLERTGPAVAGGAGEALRQVLAGLRGGAGVRGVQGGIEAGQRMLGNRAFVNWVAALQSGGRDAAAGSLSPWLQPGETAPLQLMGKKKKKPGAVEVAAGSGEQAAGTGGDAGAGAQGKAGSGPEAAQPQAPGAVPGVAPEPVGGAAGGEKKKKRKSRVQVALNALRGEGVAAFGAYVEAEIGEAELLRTLVERITRAEDLKNVRAEALASVEARRRLLDPCSAAAVGRQQPEQAVIAPVKTELTWMERELFDACIRGDIGKFRRFLKLGVEDINMGTIFGTLLCVAAYKGHTRIVRELLSVPGIDINLAGRDGITPLYCAAQNGHVKVVELLLAEQDINANLATTRGVPPLYAATLHGQEEVVRLLLAVSGINVNPVVPELNSTPLQYAIYKGHDTITGLLLAAPGIDIDRCGGGGPTLLYIAAEFGFLKIVEQLVRHGVAVNPALPDGTTPLFAAISSGNVQVARILLTAQDTRLNQATGDGIVPLGFAVSRGHKDIVELLLRHGADPHRKGIAGLTALHLACLHGHAAIVRMLLDDGADADAEAKDPDREGQAETPYSLAELGGHREIISILAAHRRRREAALPRLEHVAITGEPGKAALPPTGSLLPQSLPLAQAWGQASQGRPLAEAGGQAASPDALSPPGATAGKQAVRTFRAARGSEVAGEQSAARQATARVSPVPAPPSPPPEAMTGAEPPTPLAQARDALRREVLGKLRADNLEPLQGIRLLQDVNDTDDLDSQCVLYNRLAHIERIKERARRRKCRREVLPVPAGAGPVAADPAAAPVFALDGNTGLDAERVEVEIKRRLGQKYHRFVSQAVNNMEFGRGKLTTGHPDLWHVSAGIPGVGSCSVFYYQDAARNGIRIVGIGHHVGRAAYQLDYAAEELGKVGRVLRIA